MNWWHAAKMAILGGLVGAVIVNVGMSGDRVIEIALQWALIGAGVGLALYALAVYLRRR